MYFKGNGQGVGTLTRHFDARNYSVAITSRKLSRISQ